MALTGLKVKRWNFLVRAGTAVLATSNRIGIWFYMIGRIMNFQKMFLTMLAVVTAVVAMAHLATAETIVLSASRLIDGQSDSVINNPVIIIEEGRIVEVRTQNGFEPPAGATIIHLEGATLMPGFLDAHVHLLSEHDTKGYRRLEVTETRSVINGVINAEKTLLAGFTTVRIVGSGGYGDVALRGAINDGDIPGPRILAAGPALGVTGGHCDNNLLTEDYDVTGAAVADGPWEVRKQVRRNIKFGVDLIKFCATGGVFSKGTTVGAQQYTQEEMDALVDEAHMRGKRVAAHAHGTKGIKAAIRAGVDSVEHASFLDNEAIRMAIENGTFFSMDIYNTEFTLATGETTGALPENIEKERQVGQIQRESFRKAVAAGVKVVFGSDASIYPHGDNGKQFSRMVRFGMTPMQAIKAATSLNAELFGLASVGAIEAGRYADIVGVYGDPLEDIELLENVSFVMKGGRVYKHEK